MKTAISIAAIIAMLVAGALIEARAGECTWAGLSIGSHHFDGDRQKNYEQKNTGPHVEYCLGREDLRLFGGWNRNSKRRDSVYFGAAWLPEILYPVRAGLAAVRISGYGSVEVREDRAEMDDEPLWAAGAVLAIEPGAWGMNLLYFPRTARNVGVLAWQIKWRFR